MTNDPDRIHWPDLVAEGIEVLRQRDGAQWRLGDLALEVETTYGGHELEQYAAEIGVEYSTLRDYRAVARAYEKNDRSSNVTWTHHQRVYHRDDRLEWLKRAESKKWSVRNLLDAVYRQNTIDNREHWRDVTLRMVEQQRLEEESRRADADEEEYEEEKPEQQRRFEVEIAESRGSFGHASDEGYAIARRLLNWSIFLGQHTWTREEWQGLQAIFDRINELMRQIAGRQPDDHDRP